MAGKLVAFFSRADENYVNGAMIKLDIGNTEVAANIIEKLTEADMYKLEPVQPYSKKYNECIEQAQADQRRDARPELINYPESLDGYDEIYLGYPNYWGTMPMAVFTFLEHYDFTGKMIHPFCTHEGSGMGSSVRDIKRLCPGAEVREGLALRGGSVKQQEEEIRKWVRQEES